MKANLLFVHALTPLHPGTGQGAGVIDLPIAREVATGIPYLPGSSLKGVLRDRYRQETSEVECVKLFGPDTNNISESNSHASALQFTDQTLLLLPVRSLSGTFAWVTAPFVLQRLKRTLSYLDSDDGPEVPNSAKDEALTTAQTGLVLTLGQKELVILEDLDFTAVSNNELVAKWAEWLGQRLFPDKEKDAGWRKTMTEKLCIIHDDRFAFLLETATEVIARNVLDEYKISQNLWYEEALPAETVLVGMVTAQPVGTNGINKDTALKSAVKLTEGLTQLGGNATVGRGLCRLVAVSKKGD